MMMIMIVLALAATALALHRGVAGEGLRATGRLLVQIAPVLIPAFIMAGMASVLISTDGLTRMLGEESGLRGLVVGTVAGAVTPGGPFIAFPLLAVLLKNGASVGAVTAFLSSWALLGVHRMLAFEIPILGFRFVLARTLASLLMPVAIGWLAQLVWTRLQTA